MRWILVSLAVNFCKKCDEMRWFFFHRIHRNHRSSYINSSHSPHFLQKFTQNPRPGIKVASPDVIEVQTWRYVIITKVVEKCDEPATQIQFEILLEIFFIEHKFVH